MPAPTGTGWPEADRQLALKLWRDGLSATQIAKQFPGKTRNAIIGLVNRAGLARGLGRQSSLELGAKMARAKQAKAALSLAGRNPLGRKVKALMAVPKGPGPIQPPMLVTERVELPDEPAGLATVLTVCDGMCRWPIGDPLGPGFTLCGQPTARTYCQTHHERAHQAPKDRSEAQRLGDEARRAKMLVRMAARRAA